MRQALIDLLSSKKFITAIITAAATIALKLGWQVDAETLALVVGLGATVVIGFASSDHGKEAAKINAARPNAFAELKTGEEIKKSEGGFVDGFTMIGLALVSAFMAVVVIASSCSHIKGESKNALASIVDCTKVGIAGTVRELRPLMSTVVAHAVTSDGKLDYGPVKDLAKGFVTDVTRCAVADAVARLVNPPPDEPGAPKIAPLAVDRDAARAGFRDLFPGTTFKTEAGSL